MGKLTVHRIQWECFGLFRVWFGSNLEFFRFGNYIYYKPQLPRLDRYGYHKLRLIRLLFCWFRNWKCGYQLFF